MEQWKFKNGITVYQGYNDRTYYFDVYNNNEYLGRIYTSTRQERMEYIQRLDEGFDPITDEWEDGRGNICNLSGWGKDEMKKWIFENGIEVYQENSSIFEKESFTVYNKNELLGYIYPETVEENALYNKLLNDGHDPVTDKWSTGTGKTCSWSGWSREKEKVKGMKTVNIAIKFNPDFIPPERFDEDLCFGYGRPSCPFEIPDGDGGSCCGFPDADIDIEVKCPIRHYFE